MTILIISSNKSNKSFGDLKHYFTAYICFRFYSYSFYFLIELLLKDKMPNDGRF